MKCTVNYKNRLQPFRKVVIYACVVTEHEEHLSALENQKDYGIITCHKQCTLDCLEDKNNNHGEIEYTIIHVEIFTQT